MVANASQDPARCEEKLPRGRRHTTRSGPTAQAQAQAHDADSERRGSKFLVPIAFLLLDCPLQFILDLRYS